MAQEPEAARVDNTETTVTAAEKGFKKEWVRDGGVLESARVGARTSKKRSSVEEYAVLKDTETHHGWAVTRMDWSEVQLDLVAKRF